MPRLNVNFDNISRDQLTIGDVSFSFWHARFRDHAIPASFAPMLLNPKLRAKSISLFKRAAADVMVESVLDEILNIAAKDGLEKGEETLQKIINAKPNGEPKLYRSLEQDNHGPFKTANMVMSDGKKAFSFITGSNTDALPPNVYCKEDNLHYILDEETMEAFLANPKLFFKTLTQLRSMCTKGLYRTRDMLKAFVTDRKEYERLLSDAKIYEKFLTEALKCPQGYIFYKDSDRGWSYGYLVTPQGDVYHFVRRGENKLHDLVMHVFKNQAEIANLTREYPTQSELKAIVRHIGPSDSALALVLLPGTVTKCEEE